MLIQRRERHLITRSYRLDARGVLDQLQAGHAIYTSPGQSAASVNDHTISLPWLRLLISAHLIRRHARAHDGGSWWTITPKGARLHAAMRREPPTCNPGGTA